MSYIHFHDQADALLRHSCSRVPRGRVAVLASLLIGRVECGASAPRR